MIKKDEPNSYDLISSKDADICKCENSLTTNTTITTTKSTSSPPPKSPQPPHNARLLADTKVEEGIDIVGNHYECAASCCSLSLLACGGCQRGDASSEETIMISSKSSTTQEKMKSQPQQPQSEQQSNETNHNLSKSITTSKNEESVLSFPLLQSSGPEGTSMVMSMSSPAMSSSSSSLLAEEVSRLQTENKSLKAQLRRCKMKLKQYERRERRGEANHIDKYDDSDFGYHSHVEHRNIHIDTQQDSDDTLRTNHRRRTQNNKVHEHVHVEQTIASIGKRRTRFLTPSRSESLSRHHRRRRSRRSRRRNCCIQSHHQTIQHNNSNPGTTTHLNMSMDDMDLLFSGFASPLPALPPTITRSKYTRRQSPTSPPTRLSITQESSSTHTSSHRLQSHSKTHTNRHKSRSSSLSSTTSFSSQQKHNENKPKQTSTCTLSNEQFWKELTMRHINSHPPSAAAARRRDSIYNPDIDDDERTTTSKDQDTRIVDTCHTPQSITVTSTHHASSDMESNENDSKKKGLYERTKKHSSSEVLHMLSQMNLPLPDISVTPSDAVQEQWTNQSQKGRGKENKQDGEEGQIDHYNSIGTTSTTTGTMTMATTAVPALFPSTIMVTSTTHQELDPTPTATTTNTTTAAAATTTSGSSSTPTVTSWNLWGIFGDSDIMAEHPYDGEILRNYNDDQGPEQTRQGGRVTKKHKGGIIRTTSSTRTANTAASAPRKTMLVPKRLLS